MEIWKELVSAPGYWVSDLGNVKSAGFEVAHNYGGKAYRQGRLLKHSTNGHYYSVVIKINGVYKRKLIHRLVMLAFKGDSNLCVNHIDGNKANNKLSNLEYVTHKENTHHAIKTGRFNPVGSNNPAAILTEDSALFIKRSTLPSSELASQFGVSRSTVKAIKSGRQWIRLT